VEINNHHQQSISYLVADNYLVVNDFRLKAIIISVVREQKKNEGSLHLFWGKNVETVRVRGEIEDCQLQQW